MLSRFVASLFVLAALSQPVSGEAVDFRARGIDGGDFRLSELQGGYALVFLYNSNCDLCAEAAADIERSERLSSLVSDGKLTVVSVAVFEDDGDGWTEKAQTFPAEWLRCCDTYGEIVDEGKIEFTTVPAFFLLDESRALVCGGTDLSVIEARLSR